MAIDATTLFREVENVIAQGQGVSHYQLECYIKTGGQWLRPVRIELLMQERDYAGGYGDVIVLEALIGGGQYAYQVVPQRDDLWVDLVSIPLYENSDQERPETDRKARRYRAVLMDDESPGLTSQSPQASNQDDLDRSAAKVVQLQLMDEAAYQVRMMTVGRLYRKSTPMDALKSLLTETTSLVDSKNQQQVFGANIAEGYNTTVRDHVIIPHGTRLVDVPHYLQYKQGGLYGAGAACYLQNGFWYVFAPFDLKRWQHSMKKLTIVAVPSNRYYGAERTYRQTENHTFIVCAGDRTVEDDARAQQYNHGNAVRFTDARNLLTYDERSGNKSVTRRNKNVFEVESHRLQDNTTNARWSEQRATSNPFQHYTEMAKRSGRFVNIEWQHGDINLLRPGMPVKYITVSDDELVEVYGVLVGVNEQRIPAEPGAVVSRYPSTCILRLFVERPPTV